ncbi:MAG: UDP-3-O-[3-hydroxymyristoyl] N-acetylglucosamine deacetylase [Pseudobacteriovorax sp.]|nr:UDP-3-O-[3-hydroxymyristoyl] N-acetylglucosamine deacetylase [Pseudobacteriovorax sp.]
MTNSLKTQKTLSKSVKISGKGLHSGRIVNLNIHPAKVNSGISFLRSDVESAQIVRALATEISSTLLSTTIGQAESSISTVEHLMAALAGLDICNAFIEIDGPEVPILDGSSRVFVDEFLKVGIHDQLVPAVGYRVLKPITVEIDDQWIRIEPSASSTIECNIDFDHHLIGQQSFRYSPSSSAFIDLAGARTFCYLRDVNKMRSNGLALGGSLENAIVLNESGIENPEGLRSSLEFVEHKMIDLIGDLALLGSPIVGRVTAYKPGHSLQAKLTRLLLNNFEEFLSASTIESSEPLSDFPGEGQRTSTGYEWASLG